MFDCGQPIHCFDMDKMDTEIIVREAKEGEEITTSLNDYLWHGRDIKDTAHDVTPNLGGDFKGRLFLIPSSIKPGEITRVLREGYDAQKLTIGLRGLVDDLRLDVLLIDTHPGLNEETLLSLVISHVLLVVMRPDKQDYEGTGITVKVAQGLQVPKLMLVVNKVPPQLDPNAVKSRVERAYGCDVASVLPHRDEMMTLASEGIFSLRYPDHPMTALYRQVADRVLGAKPAQPA